MCTCERWNILTIASFSPDPCTPYLKILETQQQAMLPPKPALQKLAKALYLTPRSVIISFAYFTILTTLSLHCTSTILHQPLISSDPISSQPTKHHHITGAKDHVQVTHTKVLDCSTHSKLNCSTSKLKGLQLNDVTRIYTKP
jgi:hypothetical protein